ncbi:MAG: glycosyltransferase family 2 protein [Acidobacteria bacterium]|nr:MAG: glycosyltransferase family 2 protein [Acidobacteriota bacterium]RPJ82524.1 MAG: glycosyltransferase family 2 protein [Acidobacteriota bacterium]
MPALSVTVITRNEAANIAAALESVAWADDIVVVDAESSDDTVALARHCASTVHVRKWDGFVSQKNFAAACARHDWILSIDADERVSLALADEIRGVLGGSPRFAGFYVPRASFYLGRWIHSTDWYPDPQLRLYDRRVARWTGGQVHESVRAEGPVGRLRNDLLHYPYRDIAHHWDTINRYTTLAANQMREAGRRASVADVALRPPLAFVRNYVLKHGFTDGGPGFVVSLLNSAYVLLKFAKLWELERRARKR